MSGQKQTDSDSDSIKELSGLPRVKAPDNFEAMVRTQIADSRPADDTRGPVLWLALKFAAPMLILAVIGTAFILLNQPDGGTVAGVENATSPVTGAQEQRNTVASAQPPSGQTAAINTNVEIAEGPQGKPSLKDPRGVRNSAQGSPSGGSQDLGLSQDTPIYSDNFDPNRKLELPPGMRGSGISAEAILQMIGIKAECNPKGCVAATVAAKSIAETAGIKENDLVEAIDNKPVKTGTAFEGSVSVKSLRVMRAGKRITIDLRKK